MPQRWEYAVVDTLDKTALDQLGHDGWEAVGMVQTLHGGGLGSQALGATKLVILLKRPKQAVGAST